MFESDSEFKPMSEIMSESMSEPKSESMSEPLVLLDISNNIATVTLNRPNALNALNVALRQQFSEIINRVKASREVRVVILTGVGNAFCTGLDLKELTELNDGGVKAAPRGLLGIEMLEAIATFDRPLIGAINGFATTEGLELALFCDVLIASNRAQFADTHAKIGIVPAWGMTQKLPRLIGLMRAKELSLTGNFFSAQQAFDWGMVNRVVKPADLMPVCEKLAAEMVACDTDTQIIMKDLIDRGWQETLEEGLATERRVSEARMRDFKPKAVFSQTPAVSKDLEHAQVDWLVETDDTK